MINQAPTVSITSPTNGSTVSGMITVSANARFSVSSRQGDSQDNLVIVDQAITAFDGEALAGLWQLTVRDLAKGDAGTLSSWSLKLRDSCSPTAR